MLKFAVIGNATSMLEKSHGQAIDDADVVIRLNRAATLIRVKEIALGTRTNWLGAARDVDVTLIHGGIEELIWLCGVEEYRQKWQDKQGKYPVHFYNQAHRSYLKEHHLSGGKPTSGLMLLDYLSQNLSKASEVKVYGFDFFESASIVTMQNNALHWGHRPDLEYQYCKKHLKDIFNFIDVDWG